MSAFSAVALEVEFTSGTWTDVTSYLAFEVSPVVVRQGRPTELDDPGPGTLTFALWNDDGRWMPGNTGSPYWPYWRKGIRVRWKVTKAGTTYTRFVGWVTVIAPEFPSSSTTGSVVAVTAVDALGKLAQRRLRSNLTEVSLWRARDESTWCDAFEVVGGTATQAALLTNYSNDPTPGVGYSTFSAGDTALTFSSDQDLSAGGSVSASTAQTSKLYVGLQPTPLQLKLHFKGPREQVAPSDFFPLATFMDASLSAVGHLCLSQNGTANGLYLRNADNTSSLGAVIANVPFDNWVEIVAYSPSGSPTDSEWYVYLSDGTLYTPATKAFDVRDVAWVFLPGDRAPSAPGSWAGITALGTRTPVAYSEALVAAPASTVAARAAMVGQVVDQLPVTISTTGTLTTAVATGRWSGRSALEVLQEIVRTGSGLVWARSRDSTVYAIGSDQLYPASPVATVDTDADCLGPPRLVDGAEASPTRIDVEWPGGISSVVDSAAEADGEIRSRRVATVAAGGATAAAVGVELFGRIVTTDVRISQVVVDLLGGATDHTAALFSEASTLSGLFPTQRIRLAVPASHFGTSTVDAHVQGWTETYAPDRATVALDTTPSPTGDLRRGLTVTGGSTTITSSTAVFTVDDIGTVITGPGIPDGTTIEDVVSPTEVVISQPATQDGTGVWAVVSSKLIAVDWWGGADGAAWSSRWVAGVTSTGGSATCQGGRGRLVAGTVTNNGTVRRISGVTFTDGEIVCSVLFSSGTQGFALVGYRGDTGTAQTNTYYCYIRASGMTLGRTVAGSPATLATWSTTLTAGLLYRMRIRAVGTQHRARLWQASQPEPSGWNITVTDASLASGCVNLKASNTSGTGAYAEFDDLAVTKEG